MQPGTKLGPYEILAPLGAGGMGEVYKARDARLDRLVAIKVLPEHLAKNPDSLARFEREAKAVAALNHPNILAIHDLGKQDDLVFAVMELLDGESLRARLAHGPLPVRKATELAVQMAHGLAAAHEKGVIHRDLKPDNLWITKDGRLKILDFGLAKQATPFASGSGSLMPTESLAVLGGVHTEEGMILGTVGYMSPEQVRGEAVDARSDIFSFGAVFFEMLTGRRAFARNSASDTLAAILRDDPTEVADTSKPLPAGLHRVLDHCLEKDATHRFHDAQDLAFALESSLGDSGVPSTGAMKAPRLSPKSRLPLLAAFLAGGVLVWGATLLFRPAPAALRPVALRYLTYSGRDSSPAASPDGKTLAFTSNRDGKSRIWLKQLRGGGEVALSAGPDDYPRFSPDGASILFIRTEDGASSLYRMSVLGTDPRKVVDDAVYGDWSPDGGRIAFLRRILENGTDSSSLCLIGSEGGGERELARLPGVLLVQPRWSPDGGAILLTTDQATQSGLLGELIRVDAKTGAIREMQPARRFGELSSVAWLSDDAVIYAQAESVAGNGAGTSTAMVYRENLSTGACQPLFWSPSAAITLDLLPGGRVVLDGHEGQESLREIALEGKEPPRWLTQGSSNDRQPVFGRDGDWVCFSSNRSGNLDLWAVSSRSGVVRSLTDDAAEDWDPGYTPDGKHILWSSNRSGAFEIWMANSDGSAPRQVSHDGKDAENPTMTRDGTWVIYASSNPKGPGIWKVHPDGSGAALLVAGSNLLLPEVSPDGQFVVFGGQTSQLHNTLRVVRLDDGSKTVFQMEVSGSLKTPATLGRCRWTPDGRRLLFTGQNAQGVNGIFVQDFTPGKDTLATRRPLAGFDPDWVTESLGLSPDGKRLVLAESERSFSLMMADGLPDLGRASK
ncbi:MAG TPA: protein kinase [Holophagaceae bacterium]|nr:protein kinase [Holophagaceae bacterium]